MSHTARMMNMKRNHIGDPKRVALRTADDVRWTAVLARDPKVDGTFVYAVSSTGIYCRPSCASRRPRRDRVVFFDSTAAAVSAGYRACKRCRPDAADSVDPWIEKVRRACVYLANVDGHVSLSHLAARLGGSPYHLQRSFKRIVGVTPREYADACRLRKLKRGLRSGASVTDAMVAAGYSSSSRFYERAASKLAMAPQTYRRGAAGKTITYAIEDSPLGRLLVAATPKGVCAVFMGNADTALERALANEFPGATLVAGHTGLRKWMREIVAHLRGQRPRLELPLDIQATAFQWQVWNALSQIPYGETRTYKEVAASIGRPSAIRAVAHACASNPVSVVVPCHRVVRTSGELAGYRWGLDRKKALLAAEHRMKD
jgi:AraC family transcriptional regulator, regulatory protein of adaptative response / methylated-DNA-[protein]-cysteine methyltransferase